MHSEIDFVDIQVLVGPPWTQIPGTCKEASDIFSPRDPLIHRTRDLPSEKRVWFKDPSS